MTSKHGRYTREMRWTAQHRTGLITTGLFGSLLFAWLFVGISPDMWMSLVAGREIVEHGLPWTNTLTVGNAEWIDAQWAAQLLFYGLWNLGGSVAIVLSFLTCYGLLFAGLYWMLKLVGLGDVCRVGLLFVLFVCIAPLIQIRAQMLITPIFLLSIYMLWTQSRERRWSLWWFVPIFIIWNNLHGSVLMGIIMVEVFLLASFWPQGKLGLKSVSRYPTKTYLLLILLPLTIFINPYGYHILGYFTNLLGHDGFQYISEWQPLTFTTWPPATALIGATLIIIGAGWKRLYMWELIIALFLIVQALQTSRAVIWISVFAIYLIGRIWALEPSWHWSAHHSAASSRQLRRKLTIVMAGLVFLCLGVFANNPFNIQNENDSSEAAAMWVAHHHVDIKHIFVDDTVADYILWRNPQLRGRLRFDSRSELYSGEQIKSIYVLSALARGWQAELAPYTTIVLDPSHKVTLSKELRSSCDWAVKVDSDYSFVAVRIRPYTGQHRNSMGQCE